MNETEQTKRQRQRLPDHLVRRGYSLGQLHQARKKLRARGLHTVCESARCPNIGYCFARPTATYLICGDVCTRNCRFCAVGKGEPKPLDPDEPRKVAEAAGELGLAHVVVTSVTRDDLPDGGASVFAETIREIKNLLPKARVEVLTPDFGGNIDSLQTVLDAGPHVFNHNMETVRRLYRKVRPMADYVRSLDLLQQAAAAGAAKTKSGLMVGLGESEQEVVELLEDLRSAGVQAVTVGQYLSPSSKHYPVAEYRQPQFFKTIEERARQIGFEAVACGPLVRSSFDAADLFSSLPEG